MNGCVGLLKQNSIDFEFLKNDLIKQRKLILHFDQHNTIQVACTLPGRRITVEEGLNNFLTSVVWGKEINNEWQWVTKEPQMYKPKEEPDAISYFKYLEKKIVIKPDDRAELKKQTCKFVNDEPGILFKEFFDLYLEKLIYDHNWNQDNMSDVMSLDQVDNSDIADKLYYYNNKLRSKSDSFSVGSLTSSDLSNLNNNFITHEKILLPPNTIPADDPANKSLYHLILPDFFDMIYRLQKENRSFTIILRTMGIDSQNFLDTIRPVIEGKHRDFKHIKPIKINQNIGHIKRYSNDRVELEMDNEIYTDEESIYKKLCSLEGINAIRDDFAYWQQNDYECYSAKPLWVNLDDIYHQHILFDDNIRFDAVEDCIVNLRLNNTNSNEYENVEFESYKLFEKSSILQPNLLELLNPHLKLDSTRNHYLDQIKKAEIIYNRLLLNRESIKIPVRSLESSCKDFNKPDENQQNNFSVEEIILSDTDKPKVNNKRKPFIKINKPLGNQLKQEEQEIDKAEQKISTVCHIQ
jgi:hypothetical protein